MSDARLVRFWITRDEVWHATVEAFDVDEARDLAVDTFEAQRRLRGWSPIVFVRTRLEAQAEQTTPQRFIFALCGEHP